MRTNSPDFRATSARSMVILDSWALQGVANALLRRVGYPEILEYLPRGDAVVCAHRPVGTFVEPGWHATMAALGVRIVAEEVPGTVQDVAAATVLEVNLQAARGALNPSVCEVVLVGFYSDLRGIARSCRETRTRLVVADHARTGIHRYAQVADGLILLGSEQFPRVER